MGRGTPDYNRPEYTGAAQSVDLGQLLIANIGLPPLDGRGRLFMIETFNVNMGAWELYVIGDGSNPELSQAIAEKTPSSAKCDAGTLSLNGQSNMKHTFYLIDTLRIGVEAGILFYTAMATTRIQLSWYSGTTHYWSYIKHTPADGKLLLFTDGGEVEIADIGTPPTPYVWTPLKFVVDTATGGFVRAMVGMNEIDISAFTMASTPSVVLPSVTCIIGNTAYNDDGNVAYIGHVFITLDDP